MMELTFPALERKRIGGGNLPSIGTGMRRRDIPWRGCLFKMLVARGLARDEPGMN